MLIKQGSIRRPYVLQDDAPYLQQLVGRAELASQGHQHDVTLLLDGGHAQVGGASWDCRSSRKMRSDGSPVCARTLGPCKACGTCAVLGLAVNLVP